MCSGGSESGEGSGPRRRSGVDIAGGNTVGIAGFILPAVRGLCCSHRYFLCHIVFREGKLDFRPSCMFSSFLCSWVLSVSHKAL